MNYSSSDVNLVRQISNIYVNKISMFYVELKKKKAQIDFDFAEQKVDSLFKVMSVLDKQLIQMNETHFFTNDELMRFSIPKLNLQQYKSAIQSQYYYAVNNREAAAYKLQKETPIIETLDKPEPPYDESKKSGVMYAFIGFILGVFIGILLVSWKIISNYMEQEVNKLIEKAEQKSKEKSSQTIETRVETQVTQ